MDPIDSNKKLKKRSEFRFHTTKKGNIKLSKHPAYIFLQDDDIFLYVQLTHSKKIRGKVLIKLKKNPNPKDNSDSYFIENVEADLSKNFDKKLFAWSISKEDEKKIRRLFKIKSPKQGSCR